MRSKMHQNNTGAIERYTATYTFDGRLRQQSDEAISLIRESVRGMQEDGIDITFRGASAAIDDAGQIIELTAHYSAPSKGTVGRLSTQAGLPTSGSPQRGDTSVGT